jgi:hypothetical protein
VADITYSSFSPPKQARPMNWSLVAAGAKYERRNSSRLSLSDEVSTSHSWGGYKKEAFSLSNVA